MATKVVHLSSVHPPFDSRIFYKECGTLSRAGYEVVFVAPHDRAESRGGVRIHPVKHESRRVRRMTGTVWQVYRSALDEAGDVFHLHDPELLPIAALLRARGKCVIYDVHEDLPRQIEGKPWLPRVLWRPVGVAAGALEWMSAKICTAVVTATPTIAERFPAGKTITVKNLPMLEEWSAGDRLPYEQRPATVAYVGAITAMRGAREMVLAMNRLPKSYQAELHLAGTLAPSLETDLAALEGWRSVRCLGWQSRSDVDALLGRVRVGLVVLHPRRSYQESLPIKLFEYMAAGVPVVASDFPGWREIVQGADCGLLVDPLDADSIASAIEWLLEHPAEAAAMGQRGRDAVISKYNWQTESEKLLALYARLPLSRRVT